MGSRPQTDLPRRTPWWHWLVLWAVLAGSALIVFPYPRRSCRCHSPLAACKSNCKNLATALEMYASDNGGRYPRQLTRLIRGHYLKLIPTCPAAGRDTYSDTYVVASKPDNFSFHCQGMHHAEAYRHFPGSPRNFPQYNAENGLLDHP